MGCFTPVVVVVVIDGVQAAIKIMEKTVKNLSAD